MGWEIQWEPSWWKQGENHGSHPNSAALPGLIRGTQWGHSGSRHFQSQTRISKHLILLSNVPMKKIHETSILPFYFVCWCVWGFLRPGLTLICVVPMAWNTLCSLHWSEKCVNHPALLTKCWDSCISGLHKSLEKWNHAVDFFKRTRMFILIRFNFLT